VKCFSSKPSDAPLGKQSTELLLMLIVNKIAANIENIILFTVSA